MEVKIGKSLRNKGRDCTFQVKWVHFNPPCKIRIGEDERVERNDVASVCCVRCDIAGGSKESWAISSLHPKDKAAKLYDPEKGRKLALARALENLGIPKAARKCFWRAYFGE